MLSVDEKSQIQALERTQKPLAMTEGHVATHRHDYIRHGTPTRFAALDVATGRVIGTCKPRHRAQEFIAFLETIAAATPPQLTLHLIADNYAISSAANSTAVQPWRTPS